MAVDEVHQPVLVEALLEWLDPKPSGVYVDGTLGNAGHALAVLERSSPSGFLLGLDQDEEILKIAKRRLSSFENRCKIVHANFSKIAEALKESGLERVDGIYLDLGVSSLQLDAAERGFSFSKAGPIDMRMDSSGGVPVLEKIKQTDEKELARIFKEYGEERLAAKIARGVMQKLREGNLNTTVDLAEVAYYAYHPKARHRGIHPATRIFQALRIWVNGELDCLKQFVHAAPGLLKPGGRLCIMSYHSLEDRIVKHSFRNLAQFDDYKVLTKKPVRAKELEVEKNPRARSAKLRTIERVH